MDTTPTDPAQEPAPERLEITVVADGSEFAVRVEGFDGYGRLASWRQRADAERMAAVLRKVPVSLVEDGFDVEGFAQDLQTTLYTLDWMRQIGVEL
jgi:hypothetical protein